MRTTFIFIITMLLCHTVKAQNEPNFHYHYDKEKKEITLTIQNDTPYIMALFHSRGDVTQGTSVHVGTTKDNIWESYPYSLSQYKDGIYLPFQGSHIVYPNKALTLKLRVGEIEPKKFANSNKLFFEIKIAYGFLDDNSDRGNQYLRYRFDSDNKEF